MKVSVGNGIDRSSKDTWNHSRSPDDANAEFLYLYNALSGSYDLRNTSSAGLRHAELGLLLIRIRARGRVHNLLAVVVKPAARLGGHVDLVPELELVGVLDDVGGDALGGADVAAGDVVGLGEAAGAVDGSGDGRVVLGAVGDGHVEVPVAAEEISDYCWWRLGL